jgi:ribose-phosphate pyrophosphokinase
LTALLFALPGHGALTGSLAEGLGADIGRINWRHFPDGESLIALDGDCAERDVVIVATLREPDPLALPLLFASRTARALGARSVGLVAPYLAYMRQDKPFEPGQAVSSVHFGTFLSWAFDWTVTVDPHLHRHHDLGPLFGGRAEAVSSVPVVAEWIRTHVADPVLIGPDEESAQWLQPLGELTQAPVVLLAKERRGDRNVSVSRPSHAAIEGRTPVLFDDIVSTGQTMLQTLVRLRDAGARAPVCVAIHGVFAGEAERWLRVAGAAAIVTTNTIEHATNAIDVAPVLLPALARRLHA